MNSNLHRKSIVLAAMTTLAVALCVSGVWAEAPRGDVSRVEKILDHGTPAEVSAWLSKAKEVIELGDATIIAEVNGTAGDAGFQIFLDGDGWSNVRVFDADGHRVFKATVTSGVKDIGGGTELFLESEEPEYEDLTELQELLDYLPEGEYYFVARTSDGEWATGSAEFTHVIPAAPEVAQPLAPVDGCASDVPVDAAVIEWYPVEETISGSGDIDIVLYQVIVETEVDPHRVFSAFVLPETTMIQVPSAFLQPGQEFKFEILAIEESGNQTITEGCFETAE